MRRYVTISLFRSAVITILKNNKYPENNVRDLSLGYLLVALTYLTVGVAFYLSFPLPKACIAAVSTFGVDSVCVNLLFLHFRA